MTFRRLYLSVSYCSLLSKACSLYIFLFCLFGGLLYIRFQSRIFYRLGLQYAFFCCALSGAYSAHSAFLPPSRVRITWRRFISVFFLSVADGGAIGVPHCSWAGSGRGRRSKRWVGADEIAYDAGRLFFPRRGWGSLCCVMERSDFGLCLCLIAGWLFFPRRGWKSFCSVNKCEGERKVKQNGGQEELTPSREWMKSDAL